VRAQARRPALGRAAPPRTGQFRARQYRAKPWALCLWLLSCSTSPAPEVERALYEFERMVFVERASAARIPGESQDDSAYGLAESLLADVFEVSRDDWQHWFGAPPQPGAMVSDVAQTRADRGPWPAYCSFDEAVELARRRGMRLPRAREWMFLAAGPRGHRYPWGILPRASVANTLELGLGRPVPVGTFENGRSASGCYDLVGNVAEWVELDGLRVGTSASLEFLSQGPAVMGGSYSNSLRPVHSVDPFLFAGRWRVFGEPLEPRTRGPDLGVRCVVEAEGYLRRWLPRWSAHPQLEARLVLQGRRLGPAVQPLLGRLMDEPSLAPAARWLASGAAR
jgi:hypothetical protein